MFVSLWVRVVVLALEVEAFELLWAMAVVSELLMEKVVASMSALANLVNLNPSAGVGGL